MLGIRLLKKKSLFFPLFLQCAAVYRPGRREEVSFRERECVCGCVCVCVCVCVFSGARELSICCSPVL